MSCVIVDIGVRLISPFAAVTTSFGSKLLQKQHYGNKLYALAAVTQYYREAHGLYIPGNTTAFPHINTMTYDIIHHCHVYSRRSPELSAGYMYSDQCHDIM